MMALEGKDGISLKQRALNVKKLARSTLQKGGTSQSNLAGFLERLRYPTPNPLPVGCDLENAQ